jgi:hypothetical protein
MDKELYEGCRMKDERLILGRWNRPESGRLLEPFRVCVFHHCASVPPVRMEPGVADGRHRAGMCMQGMVSPSGASVPGGLGPGVARAGKSGRITVSWPGVQSDWYWSSSTNADNTDNAWNVNLNNGNVNNDNKTNTNYVWPVRAGEWWFRRPFFTEAGWGHV